MWGHRQKFHCFPPVQFCQCPTTSFPSCALLQGQMDGAVDWLSSEIGQLSMKASPGALLLVLRLHEPGLLKLLVAPNQSLEPRLPAQ